MQHHGDLRSWLARLHTCPAHRERQHLPHLGLLTLLFQVRCCLTRFIWVCTSTKALGYTAGNCSASQGRCLNSAGRLASSGTQAAISAASASYFSPWDTVLKRRLRGSLPTPVWRTLSRSGSICKRRDWTRRRLLFAAWRAAVGGRHLQSTPSCCCSRPSRGPLAGSQRPPLQAASPPGDPAHAQTRRSGMLSHSACTAGINASGGQIQTCVESTGPLCTLVRATKTSHGIIGTEMQSYG